MVSIVRCRRARSAFPSISTRSRCGSATNHDPGDARPRRVRRARRRAARARAARPPRHPRDVLRARAHGGVVPGTRRESILERGHEIAHHSYAHVDPSQTVARRRARRHGAGARRPRADRSSSARLPLALGRSLRVDARARRGARLRLRLEPHDGRLPSVPSADRRPRLPDRAARPRPRVASLGAAHVLRARRLGALPVQLRSVPQGRCAAERTCSRSGAASSTGCTSTSTAAC